jgi:hypothetical protein
MEDTTLERTTLPFPVLPGADARAITKRFNDQPKEYAESRSRLGITMERAYLQVTPMGDFVVAHLETERSFGETAQAMMQSDLEIDKFFVAQVKEIHGVDLGAQPVGPPPENLGVWTDPTASGRGSGFAFTAPTLPDKREAGRAFIKDAFSRDDMTRTSRELGGQLQSVTLVATPMGDMVAVYLEGKDPAGGNVRWAASNDPFIVWFRDECKNLFPPFVDLSKPIEGVSEIFDSTALLAHA